MSIIMHELCKHAHQLRHVDACLVVARFEITNHNQKSFEPISERSTVHEQLQHTVGEAVVRHILQAARRHIARL